MTSMTATIRDIAIIILAVESIIVGIAVLVLAWQVYRLTRTIKEEITPLLRDVDETVRIARGTTTFLSTNLVKPTVKVAKTTAFIRRAARTLGDVIAQLR